MKLRSVDFFFEISDYSNVSPYDGEVFELNDVLVIRKEFINKFNEQRYLEGDEALAMYSFLKWDYGYTDESDEWYKELLDTLGYKSDGTPRYFDKEEDSFGMPLPINIENFTIIYKNEFDKIFYLLDKDKNKDES